MAETRFWTVGSIAERAGVSFWQVSYCIRILGIQPAQRAGRYRLFNARDARRVVAKCREIQARRAARAARAARRQGTGTSSESPQALVAAGA